MTILKLLGFKPVLPLKESPAVKTKAPEYRRASCCQTLHRARASTEGEHYQGPATIIKLLGFKPVLLLKESPTVKTKAPEYHGASCCGPPHGARASTEGEHQAPATITQAFRLHAGHNAKRKRFSGRSSSTRSPSCFKLSATQWRPSQRGAADKFYRSRYFHATFSARIRLIYSIAFARIAG